MSQQSQRPQRHTLQPKPSHNPGLIPRSVHNQKGNHSTAATAKPTKYLRARSSGIKIIRIKYPIIALANQIIRRILYIELQLIDMMTLRIVGRKKPSSPSRVSGSVHRHQNAKSGRAMTSHQTLAQAERDLRDELFFFGAPDFAKLFCRASIRFNVTGSSVSSFGASILRPFTLDAISFSTRSL